MIFDTHCHLNAEEIYKDIDLHIEEAERVGVKSFLVVGYDKESSLLAIKIAHKYPFCYAAIGFHHSVLPCDTGFLFFHPMRSMRQRPQAAG